jgi:DNA polymerase-3 subunit delta
MDELNTLPFFGSRRLVVVADADAFVTKYRSQLEKAVQALPATGTLILIVKSWPATTKLAKMVRDDASISCKSLTSGKLPGWCVEWAAAQHDKQLVSAAAQLLVELIGAEMGQLDQELEKLAVYTGSRKKITTEDVDKLVGRSQAQNLFRIFDAIGAGDPRGALAILGRLFDQSEEPIKITGGINSSLRKLAQANRLVQLGKPMQAAFDEVGVPPYFARNYYQQLKHLGPDRAGKLYDWMLELSLDLRGNSPLPPRILLERLIIRLARKER